jgi:hypothetical protein
MRNNSAPPKWSKLWIDTPQRGDHIGRISGGRRERDSGDRNVQLKAPMSGRDLPKAAATSR